MHSRSRQPYKNVTASKGGLLVFGIGLGALLATVAIIVGLALPVISTRWQYLPHYARTYYRKLVPHPEYLPTPAPRVSAEVAVAQLNNEPIKLDLPPVQGESTASDGAVEALPVAGDLVMLVQETKYDEANSPGLPEGVPDITLTPLGDKVQLTGLSHQWQTWNNCGPATITTNMSYFGRTETQVEAAQFLKPNSDDKNVSPYELAAYARSTGMGAIVRQGGTVDELRMFLNNNFPVLTETWLVHDGDGLGHYRLITGFDDTEGVFITMDSLNGPDHKVSYEQFNADWRVFNHLYLVTFPQDQANVISAIIGDKVNDTIMYEGLVSQALAEIETQPNDAVTYFNLGEALTRLGRYSEAVIAFDQARTLGLHWRRLWYQFAPFEAYYATGRYQDVLDLAEATISSTSGLEEAYYFQGLALHATGQPGAAEAFNAAITYNPNFTRAREALDLLATGP
jgi:tetratricopeptide (TPR) repeat protein